MQATPMPALRFTSRGKPERTVLRVRELAEVLEAEPLWAALPASRARVYGSFGGFDHDAGPWDGESFERIAARVSRSDGQGMALGWDTPDPESPEPLEVDSGINLSVSSDDERELAPTPWEWAVQASPGLFTGAGLDVAGALWLRLLQTVATWPEVTWGAVLFDVTHRNAPTPFEVYFSARVPVADAAGLARGYYWANLLTEGHLETYGGYPHLARLCEEAGVACSPVSARTAAIVTCAEALSGFDDQHLAAMRDALAPVLPQDSYVWYEGPPLRVIKEAGTAFRRIAPEIRTPWFDDDPPLSQGNDRFRQLVPDGDG